MRKFIFQTDSFYHIYNRGVDKRVIFKDKWDYLRFLTCLKEFNIDEAIGSLYQKRKKSPSDYASHLVTKKAWPLVEFITYNLLPNHFHFQLKQSTANGISKFVHKITMGYSKYFNEKYHRSGALFQGTYKAVEIKTDSYLLYLSAYINGNAEIHKIAKARSWPWSSYLDYVKAKSNIKSPSDFRSHLVTDKVILKDFDDINEYKNLTDMIIKESGDRKEEIKRLLLE